MSEARAGFNATYLAISRSSVYREAVREAFPDLPPWVVPYSHLDAPLLERIAAAMSMKSGASFVDLACGLGGPGLWVAGRLAVRVTGIDSSSAAVQAARDLAVRQGINDATFVCADMAATGLPQAAFDAAMCVDAVIFAPPCEVADEVSRILKRGGRFVATAWEALDESVPLPTLVRDYRPILESAGFRVLEHTGIDERRELGTALFTAIASREEALRAELGEDADGLIAEANGFLGRLKLPPRVRRVFLVAQKC